MIIAVVGLFYVAGLVVAFLTGFQSYSPLVGILISAVILEAGALLHRLPQTIGMYRTDGLRALQVIPLGVILYALVSAVVFFLGKGVAWIF